jgi:mRNA interferase RelE/StbE
LTDAHYELRFEPNAIKQLKKLDSHNRERVFAAARLLVRNPTPPKSKKLVGKGNLWRVRVGDYRVVYTIKDEALIVLVVQVGHRRDVYKL